MLVSSLIFGNIKATFILLFKDRILQYKFSNFLGYVIFQVDAKLFKNILYQPKLFVFLLVKTILLIPNAAAHVNRNTQSRNFFSNAMINQQFTYLQAKYIWCYYFLDELIQTYSTTHIENKLSRNKNKRTYHLRYHSTLVYRICHTPPFSQLKNDNHSNRPIISINIKEMKCDCSCHGGSFIPKLYYYQNKNNTQVTLSNTVC